MESEDRKLKKNEEEDDRSLNMESKDKKLKKNEEEYDPATLCCLPDNVLVHILSLLDTKSATRMSLVSKRYESVWTLLQCLDFELPRSRGYSYDNLVKTRRLVSSFESYVKHVLQFREQSDLVSFRLSLGMRVNLEFIQICLDYAVQYKVQHLRLRGYVEERSLTLPQLLLNSSSLITLHLHNAIINCIELPKSVDLPNLKVLNLKNFEFSDRNFNNQLFWGCPNLETLVLNKCCIKPVNKLKVLEVNCLNLKNLEIKNWRSPWKCFDEHMVNVNAPKLVDFNFRGHLVKVNLGEGLPCLENASIDLCYPTACSMVNASERKQIISESFLSMLHHVCNVKFLSLSLKTIEVVRAVPDLQARAPIIFENLRVLKFTAENKYSEKTRRIDVLIFGDSTSGAKKDTRHISIPEHVLRFLLDGSPAVELLSIEIPNLSSDQE